MSTPDQLRIAVIAEAKENALTGVYLAPSTYAAEYVAIREGVDFGSYTSKFDAARVLANTAELRAEKKAREVAENAVTIYRHREAALLAEIHGLRKAIKAMKAGEKAPHVPSEGDA